MYPNYKPHRHVHEPYTHLHKPCSVNCILKAISPCRLTVMPGFVTAIARYETDTLLCADISHKIIRSDTLLDLMYELYQQARGDSFYDDCVRKFVGSIVLTRYVWSW